MVGQFHLLVSIMGVEIDPIKKYQNIHYINHILNMDLLSL